METHSNPQECLELPDFKSIHLERPKSKKANKKFGGLSIFVKSYFVSVFKYCYSDSRNLCTVMRAGGLAP